MSATWEEGVFGREFVATSRAQIADRRVKSRSQSSPIRLSRLSHVFIAVVFLLEGAALRAQMPTIRTFAGGGVPTAGPATATGISVLGGIGRDPAGNLYFSSFSGTILKVDAAGNLSVFAGTGPCCFSGDGGPATSAKLTLIPYQPVVALKTDSVGNVYLADYANVIRRIDHSTGIITTVAGTPFSTGFSGAGGPATSAHISPDGLAFDANDDLYISDGNSVVWRVDHATQIITIVAGNGTFGYSGDGGAATSAQLGYPTALAFDAAGDLFIADADYGVVRRVDAVTQIITTVAGGGKTYPPTGVLATQAQLYNPTGLTFNPAGDLLIADNGLPAILRVAASTQIITIVAGNFTLGPGFSGDGGPATSAQLSPYRTFGGMDLVVDAAGNIFFTDPNNYRVRRIDAATNVITTVAGNGTVGDGGPVTSALLFSTGIAVDSSGNVFVGDLNSAARVRRVDAATGLISTVAGRDVESALPPSGNGGPATAAQLSRALGVALDASGNLFLSDHQASVRDVEASTGIINEYAGNGTPGFGGDGGPATSAELYSPRGIATDGGGNLYIADQTNNIVRRVDAATQVITTVAGNTAILSNGRPAGGYSGDGGPATLAQLNTPFSVYVDVKGNLFIADCGNNVVRRIDALTQKISTVAGDYSLGAGFSGDNGPATAAQLSCPAGLALDKFGNLYVADNGNYRVREVNGVTGIITTLAGNGTFTYGGDGGPAASASLWPYLPGLAIAPGTGGNMNILVSDGTSGRVREISIPPVPAVFLSPSELTFGSQMAGTFSSPQLIAITNSGTGTLKVSNVSVSGTDAADFLFSSGGTCPGTSFDLAPTANCTVAVTFSPLAAGVRSATVTYTDNAPSSPQTVALQGTGLQAAPTQETITLPLSPTEPNQFQFDNNVHNFTVQYPPGTSFSGVNMTVAAVQAPQATFQQRVVGTPFANALCIVYDGEDGYCEDYQVSCTNTNGNSITCPAESTATIDVKTSYDTHQAIVNPGFLTAPIGTNNWTNIFTAFYLQRIDPTTKGKTKGFSEFFAVDLGPSDPQGLASFAFLPPLQQSDARIFPAGALIPVEFALTAIAQPGQVVRDATAGITVMLVQDGNGNPASSIILEKSVAFKFRHRKYIYALDTRGYAPGTYNVTVYGDAFAAQQVEFAIPVATRGGKLETQIQSLAFDAATKQYVATLTVSNTGSATANGVIVFASALDWARTETILPVSLGDIGTGSSETVTLTYPALPKKEPCHALLTVLEAFAGGFGEGRFVVELPPR
jgi:sugar lactone lactonase YvrE